MASYASVHHLGWSMQAAWTNFFRVEFSSVHELRINTKFQLPMCSGTCLKDCLLKSYLVFCCGSDQAPNLESIFTGIEKDLTGFKQLTQRTSVFKTFMARYTVFYRLNLSYDPFLLLESFQLKKSRLHPENQLRSYSGSH